MSAGYGDVPVLWDITFHISKNEIVSVIGSNGAGKTTTLNTISGLLRPRSGTIRFKGMNIIGVPPHSIVNLGLVHVPEGRRLFPEMTVYENLMTGAYTSSAWKRKSENLKLVYSLFPVLNERCGQTAGTLSGGEQQMLAIGRGLMASPKLLMLDEPSLGLAPLLVKDIFKTISKVREEGVTILLVEQNVKQALDMCDRAYVLENGRIILDGDGKELADDERIKKAYMGV